MKEYPRIITLRHRDSVVYDYRMNRPLVELMGAKMQRSLLRKNDRLTIEQLAQRYEKKCDYLVIKYIDDGHTLDVIYSMRKVGKFKIIIDIDDNLWQIPIGNIAMGDSTQHAKRIVALTESVKCADWVTVSTDPLKDILEPLNANISVLPNYIDEADWSFKRKKHDKVRIAWVWSPTHIPDMPIIEKALEQISKRDDVEIVIFGTELQIFKNVKTMNIKGVKYWDYPKLFMEEGIDISIAPLEDNDFNKCKSNIKWLESSMAGSAFIGSDVYPYSKSIKQGKTGYVCKGTGQWVKYMTWLIEDADKRKELVKNARKEIKEQTKKDIKKWQDFYKFLKTEK